MKPFKLSLFAAIAAFLMVAPVRAAIVTLQWQDNCATEQGFKVERAASLNGTYSQIATVGADVTSYADSTAVAGSTCYYRVRAYNGTWNSGYTNVVTKVLAPAAVIGLTATAGSAGTKKITLSWSASAGATSYIVYGASSLNGTYTQTGAATTTSFTKTGLTAGTTYFYKVAASNGGGLSPQTGAASATAR